MPTPGTATPDRRRMAVRALSLTGAAAALLSPVLVAGASSGTPLVAPPFAATAKVPAASRDSVPPNVTYPMAKGTRLIDLKSFRGAFHHGTEIKAPCGTAVRALHPGTARVSTNNTWSGRVLVRVFTSHHQLTSWYGYMRRATVSDNQIIQAGQQIGEVGDLGNAKGCQLHLEVRDNDGKTLRNPTTWLESYVGLPVPERLLFGNTGFVLATLNVLGASHTATGGDASRSYPGYVVRMPRTIAALDNRRIDVAGLQELQKSQHKLFLSRAGGTYAAYPPNEATDTENSIIWRRSSFDLVSGKTFDVPYFNGSIRHMPYVLLRQRSTGLTAYFANVHNPANTSRFHHQEKYRVQAIKAERELVIRLRATGRPVFLTGDLNQRAAAFCPLTAGKLMISPNSIPSIDCAPPPKLGIDWILVAGQARSTTYLSDWSTKDAKITDHPIVYSRAHLAG